MFRAIGPPVMTFLARSANVHSPAGPRAIQAHNEIVELFRAYGVSAGVPPLAQNAAEFAEAANRSHASGPLFVCPEFRGHAAVLFPMRSSMVWIVLPEYSRPNRAHWGFFTTGHLTASVDRRLEA